MSRFNARNYLQIAVGLTVAFGVAATRSEKVFAEMQANLPHEAGMVLSSASHDLPEPFDPARVPQSGGMASRLLAGTTVKFS